MKKYLLGLTIALCIAATAGAVGVYKQPVLKVSYIDTQNAVTVSALSTIGPIAFPVAATDAVVVILNNNSSVSKTLVPVVTDSNGLPSTVFTQSEYPAGFQPCTVDGLPQIITAYGSCAFTLDVTPLEPGYAYGTMTVSINSVTAKSYALTAYGQ